MVGNSGRGHLKRDSKAENVKNDCGYGGSGKQLPQAKWSAVDREEQIGVEQSGAEQSGISVKLE